MTTGSVSTSCMIRVLHAEFRIIAFKEKNLLNALVYESHVLLLSRRRVYICTRQKVFLWDSSQNEQELAVPGVNKGVARHEPLILLGHLLGPWQVDLFAPLPSLYLSSLTLLEHFWRMLLKLFCKCDALSQKWGLLAHSSHQHVHYYLFVFW